jgi:hypothetical protein
MSSEDLNLNVTEITDAVNGIRQDDIIIAYVFFTLFPETGTPEFIYSF